MKDIVKKREALRQQQVAQIEKGAGVEAEAPTQVVTVATGTWHRTLDGHIHRMTISNASKACLPSPARVCYGSRFASIRSRWIMVTVAK